MTHTQILQLRSVLIASHCGSPENVNALTNAVETATRAFDIDSVQRDAGIACIVAALALAADLDHYRRVCRSAASDFAEAERRATPSASDAGATDAGDAPVVKRGTRLYLPNPLGSTNVHDVARLVGSIEARRETFEYAVDALCGALACPNTPHPVRVAQRREEAARTAAADERRAAWKARRATRGA